MKLTIQTRKDKEYEYTTDYCLEQLEYDESDVIKELLQLNIKDYVELVTIKDMKKENKNY